MNTTDQKNQIDEMCAYLARVSDEIEEAEIAEIEDKFIDAQESLLEEFKSINNELKNLVSKSDIIEEKIETIMSDLFTNIKEIICQEGQY